MFRLPQCKQKTSSVTTLFLLLMVQFNTSYALNGSECMALVAEGINQEVSRSGDNRVLSLVDRTPQYLQSLLELHSSLAQKKFEEKGLKNSVDQLTKKLGKNKNEELSRLKETLDKIRQQREAIENELTPGEEDLRVIRSRLKKSIGSRRHCDAIKIRHEAYLLDVNNYFMIPSHDRLYVDHNDYERYFFKLSVGYEYTSISNILKESSPRIALLIFSHFGNRPYTGKYGIGYYGFQMFGNLTLSGLTEQQSSYATKDNSNQQKQTLGIDVSVFSALIRHKMRPDLSHQFGPIFSIGAKQTDDSKQIRPRAYAGARSTMNPEHYIDAMLGRSPGLESTRMEIRGQLPVARLGRGSRMYIGTVLNMGVVNKQPDEEDLLTVYFSWNIDFLDLFTTGS